MSERYLGIRFNKRIGIKGLKECGFVVTVEDVEGNLIWIGESETGMGIVMDGC